MAATQELKDRISGITNLPTLPQVAVRLMRIVNDPVTSSSDVAAIVGQDMSLTAKVLRLANSAFYGIPRTITNLNNAVVILGLRVINTMVLSLTVFDMFPQDKHHALFDRAAFWKHSLGCGLISKFLAQRMKKFVLFDAEEAFCAGLLHDVGKVVMEQYLHDDFRKALVLAREKKVAFCDAEKQSLGYTHTDVAAWLTGGWELPAELHAPLVYHHSPRNAGQCVDCVSLCHYADYLCYKEDLTIDKAVPPPTLDRSLVDHLGLSPVDVENLEEALPEAMQKTEVFLDIAGLS
jgi:HD-like signal output (HDOD) protein